MAAPPDQLPPNVDEGSDLSFPASDPPAWVGRSSHAGASTFTVDHVDKRTIALAVLGTIAGTALIVALAARLMRR